MEKFEGLYPYHVKQLIEYIKLEGGNRSSIKAAVKSQISDLIDSRVPAEQTAAGDELIEAFDDLPDLLGSIIDEELEHQRDLLLILIGTLLKQNEGADLKIFELEDEKNVRASNQFSNAALKDEEMILQAAEERHRERITDSAQHIIAENASLKSKVAEKLKQDAKYQKLLEYIKERDAELSTISK